jgi:hypothetical protein
MNTYALERLVDIPKEVDLHYQKQQPSEELAVKFEVIDMFSNFTSALNKVIASNDNNYSAIIEHLNNISYDMGLKHLDNNARRKNGIKLTAASFTCERLPEQYDPTMFCSGVVDYSFFFCLI